MRIAGKNDHREDMFAGALILLSSFSASFLMRMAGYFFDFKTDAAPIIAVCNRKIVGKAGKDAVATGLDRCTASYRK